MMTPNEATRRQLAAADPTHPHGLLPMQVRARPAF